MNSNEKKSMPSEAEPRFSIVIPVYGCVACLETLCDRLQRALSTITNSFEILLIDDRSPDGSWEAILDLQRNYPEIKGVRLSRNFGQHVAITAGLAQAQGDFVVVMDCDLQDPPEQIPNLFSKIKEGYDLVLAKRRRKKSHSRFRLLGAKLYFYFLNFLTNENIDGSYGSFSLLSRKVVDAFLKFDEKERHYLFILRWLGFNTGTVEYDHEQRKTGRSSYTLKRLISHALEGIFFQTNKFLFWIVILGLLFAVFGFILAVFFILQYFTYRSMPGWTSLIVIILISTGVILTSLGIVGLYVGKIFNQAKARPLYLIDSISERKKL